ncbi:hypothetical protein ACFV6Z_17230 [Streptomyces sp. NPDC059818]|uniref:hypothetical protein n=1 Tax=Streptomyces sp. NPDC059818 TaxID=3346962 RepID=UPI003667660F
MTQEEMPPAGQGGGGDARESKNVFETLGDVMSGIGRLLSGLTEWIRGGAGILTIALAVTLGVGGTSGYLIHAPKDAPNEPTGTIGIIDDVTVTGDVFTKRPPGESEEYYMVPVKFPGPAATGCDSQCKETIKRVTQDKCSEEVCEADLWDRDEPALSKYNSTPTRSFLQASHDKGLLVRLVVSGSRDEVHSKYANIIIAVHVKKPSNSN